MSHARLVLAAGLLVAGFAGAAQAVAPITLMSPGLLVRTGDLVDCTAVNADPRNTADLTVELRDPFTGSIFGATSCPDLLPGGICFQTFGNGQPVRRLDCVVTSTTKKVRALLSNVTTGSDAEVK